MEQDKGVTAQARLTWDYERPVDFSERGAGFIEGFAAACVSLSNALCDYPDAGKSYDPMTVRLERGVMASYVFDMKDGGRSHPLAEYRNYREIAEVLLAETIERMADDAALIADRLRFVAQAGEAQRAATTGAACEHAVAEGHAPKTQQETNR